MTALLSAMLKALALLIATTLIIGYFIGAW